MFALTVRKLFAGAALMACAGCGEILAPDPPDNLWPVKIDGQWGAMDENGDLVIAPHPRYDIVDGFHDGLASIRCRRTGKYGFMDMRGRIAIRPRFNRRLRFSEGLAAAAVLMPDNSEKYGYIDTTGRFVIKPEFRLGLRFSGGMAQVMTDERKLGFIDTRGQYVISPLYSFGEIGLFFEEGLVRVKQDGKWGYKDTQAEFIIPPRFQRAWGFRNSAAFGGGLPAFKMKTVSGGSSAGMANSLLNRSFPR